MHAVDDHSLHSPFLFEFYRNCLKWQLENNYDQTIEKYRKRLLRDSETIKLTDFGAKSTKRHSGERKIREIARGSLTQPKYSRVLRNIIEYFGFKNIVELGTSLGMNTAYLASAKVLPKIYSFEGDPSLAHRAYELLRTMGFNERVTIIEGNIDETLQDQLPEIVHLAFIDANHTYEATWRYYELIKERASDESVIVFDDIYWSKEMTQAWKAIISRKEVTISLDLYQLGIVFFNAELPKQNWKLEF